MSFKSKALTQKLHCHTGSPHTFSLFPSTVLLTFKNKEPPAGQPRDWLLLLPPRPKLDLSSNSRLCVGHKFLPRCSFDLVLLSVALSWLFRVCCNATSFLFLRLRRGKSLFYDATWLSSFEGLYLHSCWHVWLQCLSTSHTRRHKHAHIFTCVCRAVLLSALKSLFMLQKGHINLLDWCVNYSLHLLLNLCKINVKVTFHFNINMQFYCILSSDWRCFWKSVLKGLESKYNIHIDTPLGKLLTADCNFHFSSSLSDTFTHAVSSEDSIQRGCMCVHRCLYFFAPDCCC